MNSAFSSTNSPARHRMVSARKMALCTGLRRRMTLRLETTATAASTMNTAVGAFMLGRPPLMGRQPAPARCFSYALRSHRHSYGRRALDRTLGQVERLVLEQPAALGIRIGQPELDRALGGLIRRFETAPELHELLQVEDHVAAAEASHVLNVAHDDGLNRTGGGAIATEQAVRRIEDVSLQDTHAAVAPFGLRVDFEAVAGTHHLAQAAGHAAALPSIGEAAQHGHAPLTRLLGPPLLGELDGRRRTEEVVEGDFEPIDHGRNRYFGHSSLPYTPTPRLAAMVFHAATMKKLAMPMGRKTFQFSVMSSSYRMRGQVAPTQMMVNISA